jgi:hypothetical protein
MQKLPGAKQNLMKYEEHEFSFYGLKHSEGARDGDIYDLLNISLDNFPSMSVRKERRKLSYETGEKVYGIGSADKLFWCSRAIGNKADAEQSFASGENTNEEENGTTSSTASGSPSPQGEGSSAAFYYDGEEKFPVEASEKTFAVINKYICIFPDKMYFSLWGSDAVNLNKEEVVLYTSLEQLQEATEADASLKDGDVFAVGDAEPYSFFQFNSKGKWDSKATTEDHAKQTRWIYLMDSWGKLDEKVTVPYDLEGTSTEGFNTKKINVDDYGEIACLGLMTGASGQYAERFAKWIRPGDTIKITRVKEDDGAVLFDYVKFIKKVNYDSNSFTYFAFEPAVITSASGYREISIERVIPDLEYSLCHDNRLWGCEKDKIYASKLGDPFNFMDYSTLADASWTVGIASSEPFTGAVAYNGSPTFFKEDRIIKVSGNYPSQYSTYETADIPGVAKGSGKSLAICNGYLYYLSPEGVCAYSGSYPSIIGDDIGEVLSNGYGGAGGDKYYLEASVAYGKAVYVYDTRTRAWTKENALDAVGFTDIGRDLYALTKSGIYLLDSVKDEGTAETSFESFIEFAPIYDSHLTKKGVSRIHVSLKVNTGASVRFLLSYDGEGYKEVFSIAPSMRRNYNIPLTVRRCGYYSLKITGSGSYTVYGIGRERYFGSDM